MAGTSWLVVLLLALSSEPGDVATLIAQLGSARYADRQAAAEALEQLGPRAVPALRAARAAGDAEIRDRARDLLQKIEAAQLVEPTLVHLDYHNRPASEVLASLGRQAGVRFEVESSRARTRSQAETRTLTLTSPDPLPFWDAFDRLLANADLADQPAERQRPKDPFLFLLKPGAPARGLRWVSNYGPFRSQITDLSTTRGYLEVNMLLMAEPRLLLNPGDLELLEAVDDRGRSLLNATSGGRTQKIHCQAGYDGCLALSDVFLKMADPPGKVLRRLRGTISATVAARSVEPALVMPIAEVPGRWFTSGNIDIVFRDVRSDSHRSTTLEIFLRYDAGDDDELDLDESQVELRDDHDQPLRLRSWSRSRWGRRGRWHLTFEAEDGQSSPRRLACYRLMRTPVEIPFTFSNVRLP